MCNIIGFQLILSDYGIHGHCEAYRIVKLEAKEDQRESRVGLEDINRSIKSLFRTDQSKDSYHCLSRLENVIIIRLRRKGPT
ncbi:hypothetical protein DPMN_050613 [Dreissena polymorpha]|uniref:Uncharacterized protein n=1 Tax=Dreissena polymorpha TaxID=45954 RepID=A0A9D4CGG5_DREPO|nr:hypothetical protein DPMN_050613 [Dreissena polymorpha]